MPVFRHFAYDSRFLLDRLGGYGYAGEPIYHIIKERSRSLPMNLNPTGKILICFHLI